MDLAGNDHRPAVASLEHRLRTFETQAAFVRGGVVAGQAVLFQERLNFLGEIDRHVALHLGDGN